MNCPILDVEDIMVLEFNRLDGKNSNEKSSDRILILRPIEGKYTKNSSGDTDTRLFRGENNLHVIMDPANCLWYFKYDTGAVPGALNQRYTSFREAYVHAEGYFKKRNVQIVEVKD